MKKDDSVFCSSFPPDKFLRDVLPKIDPTKIDCLAKLFAIIVDGRGNMLSFGYNHDRTFICGKKCSSFHAEEHCIMKFLSMFSMRKYVKKTKSGFWRVTGGKTQSPFRIFHMFKKFSLYVFRIGGKGDYLNSKPCITCISLASLIGFKKLFYTDDEGLIVELRMNNEDDVDLEKYCVSTGCRNLKKVLRWEN